MTLPRERGGVLLRLGFFLLLAGGLLLWSELRRPRDLGLELDLTGALPGQIVEVDVTVTVREVVDDCPTSLATVNVTL